MVTDNEQKTVDTSTEPQAEVQVEDVTQEPVAETTEQPVAEETAAPIGQPQAKEPVAETPSTPRPVGPTPEQIAAQRKQELEYYKQQEAENQLRQKASTYQNDLVTQGYSSEEANKAANNYYEQQKQLEQQKAFTEMQRLESIGKQKATIFYAKKYKLDIDDLLHLNDSMNPGQMESIAKRISEDKKMREELASLKQERVPTQQFDTNQPAASASGSEDELLEQYINGVSNPQTEAAGRRAAHGY